MRCLICHVDYRRHLALGRISRMLDMTDSRMVMYRRSWCYERYFFLQFLRICEFEQEKMRLIGYCEKISDRGGDDGRGESHRSISYLEKLFSRIKIPTKREDFYYLHPSSSFSILSRSHCASLSSGFSSI